MYLSDTSGDARTSDEWIFVPVGPLGNEVSTNGPQNPQEELSLSARTASIPSIPGMRPIQHVRSWPAALPSLSSTMRHPSSSRRSMSNRDTVNLLHMTGTNRWSWTVENLKHLPLYYHVEATAMRFRGLSIESISKSVSNFLRVNSILATYHGDHVECTACGFLKFIVQFWQGDDPDVIIVEVQRRTGCILQMRKTRRAIHESITYERNDDAPPPVNLNTREIPRAIADDQNNSDPRKKLCAQSKKQGCQWTLQTAQRLLASSCVDQNKLGMESLVSLVDMSVADPSVASCVSGAIVCGRGKHSEHIRAAFGDYFHDTRLDNDNEDVFEDDYDETNNDYARGQHFGMLHMIALQVLEKALMIVLHEKQQLQPTPIAATSAGDVENTNNNKDSKADIRSWFWRNVLEALIYNVEVADCRPLEAALSSKCLSLIMTLEPELQHCKCIEERLIPGLVYAHGFGKAHHLQLETESENLMSKLY